MKPETSGLSVLTTLISVVVIVAAMSIAREVLIPVTLAILLSFMLAPLVGLLRRLWLGRTLSVLLAVTLALGVILGVGGVIGAQVAGLAGDIPRYATTIEQKLRTVQAATVGRISGLANRLSASMERGGHAPGGDAKTQGSNAAQPAPADKPAAPADKPMPVEVHQPDLTPTEVIQRFLTPILAPLATTGIVIVVAIFILMRQEDLRDRLIRLLGTRDQHRTMTAMDDAGRRLSRYFLTLLAVNTAFGCEIGLGLFVIGVPRPLLWGIVALLTRFVPYIGAFLASILPLALAAAVDPGWSMVLWTGALFLLAEGLMGQIVEPVAYGRSTGLSPLAVVLAAIFWGWMWGPVGLILSMPLTLCLVILGRHVERLEFLDVLLGDRPALTPVESFYNRILAGNLDEAQDDAELALKTRSLSSYYDDIAIPGLRMAVADIEWGLLTEAQTLRIISGVEELLAELSDHDDIDPTPRPADTGPAGPAPQDPSPAGPPLPVALDPARVAPASWRAPSSVLCVAGSGPLDHLASVMLAQLLDKHDIGARVLAHASTGSRAAIAALDPAGARMVCLTYASLAGSPSHLRYAVRRLRARLPRATILIGLWPADARDDERLRAAIEADGYCATLRAMVATCIAEAAASGDEPALTLEGVVSEPR